MRQHENVNMRLGRRAFFRHGTLVLAAAAIHPSEVFAFDDSSHLRVGLVTDLHYADNVDVRKVFESSGKVLAVFQGHSHQNDLREIGGIHYCTLVAMVEGSGAENNGYSLLSIDPNGTIQLKGFRKQKHYAWDKSA